MWCAVKMQCKVEECPQLGMRTETYTTDAIRYEEVYDTETGKQVNGIVYMYDKIQVCAVFNRESIGLTMPVDWVMNHKDMLALIANLKTLDEFLCQMVPNYGRDHGSSDTRG